MSKPDTTSTGRRLADHDARVAIREHLDVTLIVEAAAGAGKTTELVRRVLALLERGRARLSTLVAVTFTEKAAGEMKLRLRTAIERARISATDAAVRERLERAARELEVAHIGTIHGFCADLLRERPVEAGIDPLFTVADEAEARRLYGEAFEPWFQGVLGAARERFPGVHRVLRRRSRDDSPRDALFDAGYRLVDQRDFDAPWTRPVFDRERSLDELCAELAKLGELAALADDQESDKDKNAAWLYLSLDEVRRFAVELGRKEASRGGERDYDGLEAELRALSKQRHWGWKGRGAMFSRATGLTREAVLARRAETKLFLDQTLATTDADLAACLREELRPLVVTYAELKARAGKLDFLDLLLKTRALLDASAEARRSLRARYTHLLVDEFQDTDPLQSHILFSLGRSPEAPDDAPTVPGKLFFVGDPKQSIYRFRRADVAFYEATKRRLLEQGATLVHLTTSFRSVPALQGLVNATFARAMRPSAGAAAGVEPRSQAEYVPLSPFRGEGLAGQPAVVALPVPRPYSAKTGKVASYVVEESLPDAVGAFVDWLVHESGYLVEHHENGKKTHVPVTAAHVCLLFKRFSSYGGDVTRPYVRALEARRIAHVLVGGRGFHEREEVLALRNAAKAIEYPFDEFAVYATLKGPLFSLLDSAIFSYRAVARSLDACRRAPAELDAHTAPVAEALGVLRELHRARNRRPFADTLAELLERTRAHAGFAIWPTGEQALANVLRVLDLGRRATHAPGVHSFRAFVAGLEEDAARGNVSEAFVLEEDAAGVRMMTVHRAKGLEFPVVILVDPTARPTHVEPSRFVDAEQRLFAAPLCGAAPLELSQHRERVLAQDHEEAVRLLYVATTRARDMLVVPVVGDGPLEDSWLGPLAPALYPPAELRSRPDLLRPTPMVFGTDSVLDRPEKAWNPRPVRPGWHVPEAGGPALLFFDPAALGLDKEDEAGLRQQKILAPDDGSRRGEQGQARYDAWLAAQDTVRGAASAPQVRVATPTERKDSMAERPGVEVAVVRTDTPREGRPHGKRYGVLVHALLAEAPLDGSHAAVLPALARAHGRSLGATAAEIAFAARAVSAALEHEVLRRAGASTDARREVGVTLRDPAGVLIEGVVDLAFREADGSVTVVDFKTDVDEQPRLASYRAQVTLYAEAIALATGAPARGLLLLV